jgi:hypothetical protein
MSHEELRYRKSDGSVCFLCLSTSIISFTVGGVLFARHFLSSLYTSVFYKHRHVNNLFFHFESLPFAHA